MKETLLWSLFTGSLGVHFGIVLGCLLTYGITRARYLTTNVEAAKVMKPLKELQGWIFCGVVITFAIHAGILFIAETFKS